MAKPISPLNTQADNGGSVDNNMKELNEMNENQGPEDDNGGMGDVNPDGPSDDTKLIDKPPANFMPNKKPDFPSLSFLDHDPHDHGHDYPPHDHSHEHEHEHEHHHHHHDDIIYDHAPFSPYDDSLKHLHGFNAFPGNFFAHFVHFESKRLLNTYKKSTKFRSKHFEFQICGLNYF